MAGKPSKISEQGRKYLEKNPTATAEKIAIAIGMSVSGVQKSKWWKTRNTTQSN